MQVRRNPPVKTSECASNHRDVVESCGFMLRPFFSAQRRQQHRCPKYKQHGAPDQIDVQIQRTSVSRRTSGQQPVKHKHQAVESKDEAEWQTQVEVHIELFLMFTRR